MKPCIASSLTYLEETLYIRGQDTHFKKEETSLKKDTKPPADLVVSSGKTAECVLSWVFCWELKVSRKEGWMCECVPDFRSCEPESREHFQEERVSELVL